MAKDIAKYKEEMRADFAKHKEEMKLELKTFRESLERDFRSEIRELRTELQTVTQSLEFAHSDIADLKKELIAAAARNTKLESENEKLREQVVAADSKVRDFEIRLISSEQYSRNANIEIQGVIEKEGESVMDIISKMGQVISEPISQTDVETCHRVPTKKENRTNIIVRFRSRVKRDQVLRKAKKMRLTNRDVGHDEETPIFVNEHLCPALKKLLAMAVKKKHECHWKSVWSFKGKIYAKKAEGTPIIPIKDESDLKLICPVNRD